jgi:hypothetical protein
MRARPWAIAGRACHWSGGGSLSLFYQAQAERPTITLTPPAILAI